MKNLVLVVSGGSGNRYGGDVPKQYATFYGKPILRRSVETFLAHPAVDSVIVVINKNDLELYRKSIGGLVVLDYVVGGDDRQSSVRNGLRAIRQRSLSPKNVLIHDAARPFVSIFLISQVIEALSSFDAVDVRLPVADSLRNNKDGQIIDRSSFSAIQTPQGFDFETIYRLHEIYSGKNFPDDISLCYESNLKVGHVKGEVSNIKVTYSDDLKAIEGLV